MNIQFSEQELRDLLDIAHIADIVLSGHRREPDQRSERHRALIQRIYGQAAAALPGGPLGIDEQTRTFVPNEAFEHASLAHPAIDEFSDHLFWDELIARLSVRDAARQVGGIDRLHALNDSSRQAAEGPVRRYYIEEFSKNGIEHLEIVAGLPGTGQGWVITSD